jgi:bifunctional non-homologous end joining protein LigD
MPTQRPSRTSNTHFRRPLPYVEPVTLVPGRDPFDDPDWMFEPKYAGFRGLVYASQGQCEIRSRRDVPFRRYQDLWERVGEVLAGREAILDGEIVSLNRQGKPVLQDLIRLQGFIAFAAFDLLWLDGRDLRTEPLATRKELLSELLPQDTGPLYKILTIEEHGRALFSAIRKMDLEGIVAKRKSDAYGPRAVWYRIANPGHQHALAGQPFPARRSKHSVRRDNGRD